MRLIALTILTLVPCGCSQRQSDLQQARTTRSVRAEWGLVAGMRARLPDVYVRQMRAAAQSELGGRSLEAR